MRNVLRRSAPRALTLAVTLVLISCGDTDSPLQPDGGAEVGAPSRTIEVPKNGAVEQDVVIVNPAGLGVAYDVVAGPEHGTLQIRSLGAHEFRVTYAPDRGFAGADVVRYRVQAGGAEDEGTITFDVLNSSPEVEDALVSRPSSAGTRVHLTVTEPDGDVIEVSVQEAPEHGSLGDIEVTELPFPVGSAAAVSTGPSASYYAVEVRYEPDFGSTGADAFRLAITDESGSTSMARVDVFPNEPPSIPGLGPDGTLELEGTRGESVGFTLEALSPMGQDLQYHVTRIPDHGAVGPIQVTEVGPAQAPAPGTQAPAPRTFRAVGTYTADPGFAGTDQFEVSVHDGVESTEVAVEVTVVNTPPSAEPKTATGPRYESFEIVVAGFDPNGFPLEFAVVDGPDLGSVSVVFGTETVLDASGGTRSTARVIYTPAEFPEDSDAFAFTVFDGVDESEPARVEIVLDNTLPVADDQHVAVARGETTVLLLSGSDADGHPLTFVLPEDPDHGSLGFLTQLTNTTAAVPYTPDTDYVGPDGFAFHVHDGHQLSSPAQVTLDVVNQAPEANDPGPVTASIDTPVDLVLTGSDPDGDPLRELEIVTAPTNGTLSGLVQLDPTSFRITYTPEPGFTGLDPFAFRVLDDVDASLPVTVQLTVEGPAVGSAWEGGIVFEIDGAGTSGRIASTADNSVGIEWGAAGVTPATSDTDGAGNTASIVATLGANGGVPYAAQVCNNYEVDGAGNTPCQPGEPCYADWHLPARDELDALYAQRVAVGGFASAVYWSSTEVAGSAGLEAWTTNFDTGGMLMDIKSMLRRARCVRAFGS